MSVTVSAAEKQTPPAPTAPRPFEFPRHVTKKLANGLTIFIVEDHRLPLVSYSLDILAGGVRDGAAKAGVASMTAALLREGTATRSSEQLSALIDNSGGTLSASADEETTGINAGFMKAYADLGMDLMSDIVLNPKFEQEEIDRQMQQALSGMAVQYSDVSYLSGIAAGRAVFGAHPYGYPNEGTPASLRSIKREDLLAFHKKYYAPGNAYLAIAGDLTAEEAVAKAEKYFGSWKNPAPVLEKMPAAAPASKQVLIIDMPKAVQTQIYVGQPMVPRNHPDYIPLSMGNQIFGGSFNSRLNMKLRANEGLTYGASSGLQPYREAGSWGVKTFTQTARTADAIRMILDLLKEYRQNPATEAEFKEAQQFMIGAFGLSVETAGAVAGRVVTGAVYQLGDDYWRTYRQKLEATKVTDVTAAVQKHLQPEKFAIVAVGNAKEFAKALEPFGTVKIVRGDDLDVLSESLMKAQDKVVASADGGARAKATLQAAVAAMGGLTALKNVKDMTAKGSMNMFTPQGEMSAEAAEEVLYPNGYKITMKLPFGEMTQAWDGTMGWMAQGAITRELPADMTKEVSRGVLTTAALGLLIAAAEGQAEVQLLEPAELEGNAVDSLLWKQGDFEVKILVDAKTHLPAKISYRSLGMGGGSVDTDATYSDYRDVSGVKLPFKEVIHQNGQKLGERLVMERKINSGLSAEIFKKK